jgi:hypothetical protein
MTAASTPGPWSYEQDGGDWSILYDLGAEHGPRRLGKIFDHACEFQEEDARLIAAAPDLFAALDGCCEHMEWSTPQGKEAYIAARLALAKASEAAIATEARRAETVQQGSVHEGAGRKASPTPNHHSSR